jgi:transcription elongation GreA/GreB family factor
MDKKTVIKGVIEELERQRGELETGLRSAEQAAIDSPGAMQSHSDTTKSQMHTLAMNIKNLVKQKDAAIRSLNKLMDSEEVFDSVKEGALVETTGENNEKNFYIIVPEGGAGTTIVREGAAIISITLATPLGTALSGKTNGENAILKTRSGERKIKIINIF